MDSIEKLLHERTPKEPPQVRALRTYVKDKYNEACHVEVARDYYLLRVPSAGLAQLLRFEMETIKKTCGLDKRLVIHIGI